MAATAGTVGLLSGLYLVALHTRIRQTHQAYVQLTIDLIIVTWLVYNTGDVESPFPALYLVIIFAASTLFGRRGVFALAITSASAYSVLNLLVITGVIPRATGWPTYDPARGTWIQLMFALNVIAVFAVATLSSHLAERMRRSETDLVVATKSLADYRLYNDRIIESIRSGLITTDLDGNIITFNRAAEEITGHKGEDVQGKSIFLIFGDIKKQIEAGLESLRTRSRLPRFDIGCLTAHGKEIHLGFSVAPLVDEANHTRGYVVTFQDLTDVMELEREVRRQERLAALGKMAAGLAHEIRNPLASMRGSVQVLANELNLSTDQSQLMEIVLRESDRLNRIVSDFLTYARPPRIERTVVELSNVLSETVALLRNSTELKPNHQIIEEYPQEPVYYNADPAQLRQIFWNLSRNSMQAMPLGGELRITLSAPAGSDVTIVFADTGMGMSQEQKERLFEPFNSRTGTGLGMAIVYQLVRDHNGRIIVDSEGGKGTRISLKLPASGCVAQEIDTLQLQTRASGSIN